MMTTLLVTIPVLVILWIVYTSRDLMMIVGRWILHRRYAVTLSGVEALKPDQINLVIPNHPAIVDPLILVPELYGQKINVRPLVDESYFSDRIARHLFALVNSVRVPDFRHVNFRSGVPLLGRLTTIRRKRMDAYRRAKALCYTVLATLTEGGSILVYPSGHITTDGRERIQGRSLVYNVISQMPKDVRIIGVRMRGIYGSIWSRVGGRPPAPWLPTFLKAALILWPLAWFRKKRQVSIYFEDITDECREWATKTKAEFISALENWYDADLRLIGRDSEEPT